MKGEADSLYDQSAEKFKSAPYPTTAILNALSAVSQRLIGVKVLAIETNNADLDRTVCEIGTLILVVTAGANEVQARLDKTNAELRGIAGRN